MIKKDKNMIIVANKRWGETVPEWMLEELKAERMMIGIFKIIDPDKVEDVGDVEASIYLYTESLTHPLSAERTKIYVYLSSKVMKRKGMDLQDFMEESLRVGLTDWERRILAQLKHDIYTRRGGEIDIPLFKALKELKKGTKKKRGGDRK